MLDETALFLHRIVTDLPPEKQSMLERLHNSKDVLRGRKVLVVDDDARNIFALTSVLENQEMEVISATNGRQAIDLLKSSAGLGYRSHGHHDARNGWLRDHARNSQCSKIPHSPDPRPDCESNERRRSEKCLDAGASDYIAKPGDEHSATKLDLANARVAVPLNHRE